MAAMKIPFLGPVVPPHVFCLLSDGVTYAQVRREPPAGIAQSRFFAYPAGTVRTGAGGALHFTREAVAESVEAARRLSDGRLSRASVVFPDAWARIMPIEFDTLPDAADAVRSMAIWKLKKLLPASTAELSVEYREMPPVGEGRRLLVAAASQEMLQSIEESFEALGVRVGALAPQSLALLDGLSTRLTASAGGDWAFVHRCAGSLVFTVSSGGKPILFRQRPGGVAGDGGTRDEEVRLSLSYYSEKLKGTGLAAVYIHDAIPGDGLAASFPVLPVRLGSRLLGADPALDERVAARPELLAAFAAVCGRA
jgi:hypothetical protein